MLAGLEDDRTQRLTALLTVGLVLVLVGTAVSWWGHTAGGAIERESVAFETEGGIELAGTVYRPAGASADDPVPGVVAVHGYSGSKETMSTFAVELARRGYAVLAVDQPGHGKSEPPVGTDRLGGPASLAYFHSLPYVADRPAGLVGHSMGGSAVMAAADAHPDGHRAVVLVGADPSGPGVEANATFPRNVLVAFGAYDEFGTAGWEVDRMRDVPESEELQALFGVDSRIDRGRVYGDVDAGTGRMLVMPPTIHVTEFVSPGTVRAAVDWIVRAVPGGEPAAGVVWPAQKVGSALAYVGVLAVLLAVVGLVAGRLDVGAGPGTDAPPTNRRFAAVAVTTVTALAFYPTLAIGTAALPAVPPFGQGFANAVALWGAVTIALSALAFRGRRLLTGDGSTTLLARLREVTDAGRVARAGGAVLAGFAVAYVLVALVGAVAGTHARAVLVWFPTMTTTRWLLFVAYAPVAVVLGMGIGVAVNWAAPAAPGSSTARAAARSVAVVCGGLALLLAVQYVPLLWGGALPVEALAVGTTFGIPILLRPAIAAVAATIAYRSTDDVWTAGFTAAVVLLWMAAGGGSIEAWFG